MKFTLEDAGAELKRRMELVTIANGAETDLGKTVYRGVRKIDDDMMPCCVIVEGDVGVAARAGITTNYNLRPRFFLQAYVAADPGDPNIAGHAALRDMKRAVFRHDGKVDTNLGGRLGDLEFVSQDIAPRVDGAAYVLAAIELVGKITETVSDP